MYVTKVVNKSSELVQLNQFIDREGLVQQSFLIKDIYRHQKGFQYRYIICVDDKEKIVGVFPFIHFSGPYGDVVHSMPFIGYGGACWLKNNNSILSLMIEQLHNYCEENNILTMTICTSPFSNQYENYMEIMRPDFIQENFYQYISLDNHYLSRMTSKNRNNLKRNLRIAQNNGIFLKEDYEESSLRYWYYSIYVPRLTETGGAIYPYDVFNELRKVYGGNRVIIQYTMQSEKIIGAGIFLKQQESLDNFMRVIDKDYMRSNAGVLLDNWSIKYAMEAGFSFYNWQSSDCEDSPIFNYKKTWGSEVGYHHYLTKVVNPIDSLLNVSLEEIKNHYKGIYIMPFSVWNK